MLFRQIDIVSTREQYTNKHAINSNQIAIKVLNIGYRDRIGWWFSYRISDIRGDIGDTHAYRAFISDTIYNEILITKSWFRVIDIIYLIKMM